MSYSDDAVRTKLSALNETQESIVTVSQWVMFHRRFATQTAQLWLQRLKDSGASKRLNLIYLANEVVQQSKVRRKEDFLVAFSPIIAEATAVAYRGATSEVQSKLRRVVEVWRQRQIFDQSVLEAIEAQLDALDKNRSASKKPLLGGSLFSTSSTEMPTELEPLGPLQLTVSKASVAMKPAITASHAEFAAHNSSANSPPPAPVQAARLNSLLRSLVKAESAVVDSLKARHALVAGLEKIIQENKQLMLDEETFQKDLGQKREQIEVSKREVEDAILQGLTSEEAAAQLDQPASLANGHVVGFEDFERPQMEPLTPPPIETSTNSRTIPTFPEESNTPVGSPIIEAANVSNGTMSITASKTPSNHRRPESQASDMPAAVKRRKTSDMDFDAFANGDDLDDDLKAMLT